MKVFMVVRRAQPSDLDELNALQHACYPPGFHEDPAVFARIVEHGQSYVLESTGGSGEQLMVGYALVHAIGDPDQPPSLNTAGRSSPAHTPEHVFIHDVSVLPEYRDKRYGSQLVSHVLLEAQQGGAQTVTLISVQGSQKFWEGHGFACTGKQWECLHSYGAGAVHMALTQGSSAVPAYTRRAE